MSSPVTGVYFRPGPATRSCTANYNRLQDGSLVLERITLQRGFDRRKISRNARVSFTPSPPAVSEKLKWWFLRRVRSPVTTSSSLLSLIEEISLEELIFLSFAVERYVEIREIFVIIWIRRCKCKLRCSECLLFTKDNCRKNDVVINDDYFYMNRWKSIGLIVSNMDEQFCFPLPPKNLEVIKNLGVFVIFKRLHLMYTWLNTCKVFKNSVLLLLLLL